MIRLHHCPQTRSMRTLWLLHEIGCPFEVEVHPFGKNLRTSEFLGLSPAGRVPALEIDGQVIWETGAITQVLCERFPEAGLGRPVESPERAEWLIWLHFSETVSAHSATLTQQHVMLYEDHMRSPILTRLEAKRLAKCYAAVERQLSDGRASLLKGGISAADISVGQAIYMARHFARLKPFEALSAWYARISERPGFAAALPQPGQALLYEQDFYDPLEV
ncbi:glutathione S-transferase [Aliiruegeria haliotis]|uniref:Glutathione S-transferase n=1 Tax=Aliiruegeria haliotis TaxID=1280846 RepID=A0A2T0RZ80_9RHOB|nr:glutathione S-transferase family protein [Aliiruegeria haliotis]PRY26484.1 glutathione S-transferase [Aliiruegeria haliotis]